MSTKIGVQRTRPKVWYLLTVVMMAMRIQTRRWRSLLLLLLIVVAVTAVGAASRREIDWDALEKAWDAGDAPSERRSGADDQYDQLSAMSQPQAKVMGPQMVFVTLQTKEPISELASRWKEMLWNGGVDVNIYEIEASKVLLGLQKGLFVRELRVFLHQQHEVVSYDWNSKTYTRDDTIEEKEMMTTRQLKQKSKKKKKTKPKPQTKKPYPARTPMHDGL